MTLGRSKSSLLLFLTEGCHFIIIIIKSAKCVLDTLPLFVGCNRYFLPDQKILFLAEVIGFRNLENMGNYSTRANFKRDFQKMDFFGI